MGFGKPSKRRGRPRTVVGGVCAYAQDRRTAADQCIVQICKRAAGRGMKQALSWIHLRENADDLGRFYISLDMRRGKRSWYLMDTFITHAGQYAVYVPIELVDAWIGLRLAAHQAISSLSDSGTDDTGSEGDGESDGEGDDGSASGSASDR